MREKFKFSIKLSMIGNIFFIGFGLICTIFHVTYSSGSVLSKILEILAYMVEISGFATLIFADYLMISTARDRGLMKIGFSAYIILEALMMVFELNSYRLSFYKPYSLGLAIAHTVVSALVCLAFLELEVDNKKLEPVIIISSGMIFAGMLGNIMGIRIYFSIIVNAVAFTFMFYMIKRLLENQDLEVDCHGDRATVTEYSNTFFKD